MKGINIRNFRCFEEQEICFAKRFNVFIGDNASGKTAVLNAVRYALSAFFHGFSDENTRWQSPIDSDFRVEIGQEGVELPGMPIQIEFTLGEHYANEYDCKKFRDEFCLEKRSKKNSRALVSGIKSLKSGTSYIYDNLYYKDKTRRFPLPVFSYFSTEDIHRSGRVSGKQAKLFMSYTNKSSFGYYGCLEDNALFELWIRRLLSLKEGRKNLVEIEIVRKALIDSLGEGGCNIIQDVHIRPIINKVFFEFIDGREVELELLSDGYKRLVNIIMNISFRAALLNKELYQEDAAKESFGTVLIDEIDMHLHPALQTLIIKGLKNAFPKIQFILTTHAPMVLSSIQSNEDNKIHKLSYSLENGYELTEVITYGKDVSSIVEVDMGQKPRDLEVDRNLSGLFELIDNDDFEAAKEKLKEMRDEFGDYLPDLYEAETMIRFLEPEEDD